MSKYTPYGVCFLDGHKPRFDRIKKIKIMFTGEENHKITLEEGAQLTANYRNTLMTLFGGVKGGYMGKKDMLELLTNDEVVGFRYYFGVSIGLPIIPQIVIVGVDADGNDLTEGIILDKSLICPPLCPPDNPLNS